MSTLPELAEFPATDQLLLAGLLYSPSAKTDKVIISLHGMGSSGVLYHQKPQQIISQVFNQAGFAYFPFNNRGAHYLSHLATLSGERKNSGMSMELISECIADIDGAINYLGSKGFQNFYLMGHSTGANKAVLYNYLNPKNLLRGFILTGGGDDTGLYYQEMGESLFSQRLALSKKQTEAGNGAKLITNSSLVGETVISYQSLYDILNPDGKYNIFPFYQALNHLKIGEKPLFQEFRALQKPTLVLYGSQDEYCYNRLPEIMTLLKKNCSDLQLFEFKTITEADHSFHGHEKQLAEACTKWLISLKT